MLFVVNFFNGFPSTLTFCMKPVAMAKCGRGGKFIFCLAVFLVLVALYTGSSCPPDVAGVQDDGFLAPCRGSYSNCISSTDDEEHPPFQFRDQAIHARNFLLRAINQVHDTSIVSDEGAYIHVATSSYLLNVWHDFEFLISQEMVHFRCTSRTGIYAVPLARRKLAQITSNFEQLLSNSTNSKSHNQPYNIYR